MTVFARFSTLLVLISAVAPILAANSSRTNNYGGNNGGGKNSCKSNEFWYPQKNCCLPHGGLPSPPPPPSGSDCPPFGYYWHPGQGCCVPDHEEPGDSPPPQCRRGWSWSPHEYKCCPTPHTTTYNPPKPSKTPGHDGGGSGGGNWGGNGVGNGDHNGGHYGGHKRSLKSRAPLLCPSGHTDCPIAGAARGEYECIDEEKDLRSCGGCASLGLGKDCKAIPNVKNVACERRVCTIHTCVDGFKLSFDGKQCIPS